VIDVSPFQETNHFLNMHTLAYLCLLNRQLTSAAVQTSLQGANLVHHFPQQLQMSSNFKFQWVWFGL
jgi:hypothetical protein